MNTLCICAYGHSRSVAMARYLHFHGKPAFAAGFLTAGDALYYLCDIADRILVMEEGYEEKVHHLHRHKVTVINVGPDKWSNPYSHELADLINTLYREQFPGEI